MSEIENSADHGAPRQRPTYDETGVNAEALNEANSTTPEVDRKAFNPRGRLQSMGKGTGVAVACGAAFVGFIVFSMASQSDKGQPKRDDSTFQLGDDVSAEKSARQRLRGVPGA